jgi:hypothetical protein
MSKMIAIYTKKETKDEKKKRLDLPNKLQNYAP